MLDGDSQAKRQNERSWLTTSTFSPKRKTKEVGKSLILLKYGPGKNHCPKKERALRLSFLDACSQVQMRGCWAKSLPSVPSQSSCSPGTRASLLAPNKSNPTIHSSSGSGSKCAKFQICGKRKAKQEVEGCSGCLPFSAY